MTTIVGAPAPTPSEEVGRCTAHRPPAYPSEAFIVCCVLAEISNAHGNVRYMDGELVRTLVARKLDHATHEKILDWASRVDRAEHRVRWNAARTAVSRFYAGLPGADRLPAYSHTDCICE